VSVILLTKFVCLFESCNEYEIGAEQKRQFLDFLILIQKGFCETNVYDGDLFDPQ